MENPKLHHHGFTRGNAILVLRDAVSMCFNEFIAPETRLFCQSWIEWRSDQILPKKSDIDLASIRFQLSRIRLLERIWRGGYRIRLAGTAFRNYYGYESTGRIYDDLIAIYTRDASHTKLDGVLDTPCGCHGSRSVNFGHAGTIIAEEIFLPLMHDDGRTVYVISYTHFLLDLNQQQSNVIPNACVDASLHWAIPEHFQFMDIGLGTPDSR